MKTLFPVILFFLFCNPGHTQDYRSIDSRILSIATELTYSTDSIAKFITANFSGEEERVRAAYTWVTVNIRYDSDSMYIINSDKDPAARIRVALLRRKGVCENYAAIFNDIVSRCTVRSIIVNGYTKQYDSIDKNGHSWCAANISGEWYLFDPTWDEGRYSKAGYNWYMKSPGDFINSHMPFDPLWQLIKHPISHKTFYSGNSAGTGKDTYNFKDSVEQYLKLSTIQQLEASILRIQQMGIVNDLVKNNLAYVQLQAGIIHEAEGMELYNAAVRYFNNANDTYNRFIRFRNKLFMPAIKDEELRLFLKPTFAGIDSAKATIELLIRTPANEQYDPELLSSRISTLARKAEEQEQFIQKYLSASPETRKILFY